MKLKQATLEKIFAFLIEQPYKNVAALIQEIQADLSAPEEVEEVEEIEAE